MDAFDWGTIFIRFSNAILWTLVVIRIFRYDMPVSRLIRQLIGTILIFGMWVLVIGGLISLGVVSGDVARNIYTVFTVYAGIVALAIITLPDR